MKEKKKIIVYSVFIIILFLCSSIIINALTINHDKESKVDYTLKYAYNIREDGWYDAFKIYLKEGKSNQYMFNGYNLKYDRLDNYYIPVIDTATGKVIEKIEPPGISLAVSEDYREDIKKINEYFTEKQFEKIITEDDVKDLKLYKINKEYIISLFNKAINSKEITETGQYIDSTVFNRVEVESTNIEQPGTYILSYTIDYGFVSNVYIDFKYNDGSYLKSKIIQTLSNDCNVNNINILQTKILEQINEENSSKIENNNLINEYITDKEMKADLIQLLAKTKESLIK